MWPLSPLVPGTSDAAARFAVQLSRVAKYRSDCAFAALEYHIGTARFAPHAGTDQTGPLPRIGKSMWERKLQSESRVRAASWRAVCDSVSAVLERVEAFRLGMDGRITSERVER